MKYVVFPGVLKLSAFYHHKCIVEINSFIVLGMFSCVPEVHGSLCFATHFKVFLKHACHVRGVQIGMSGYGFSLVFTMVLSTSWRKHASRRHCLMARCIVFCNDLGRLR